MEKKRHKRWPGRPELILFSLLAVNTGYAANIDSLLVEGRQNFYQAVNDQEQIAETLSVFETISRNYPERQGLARTYIGATVALKGKHAFLPQKKLRFVREGLQQMENALQQAPEDIEALFIYGMTCYHLPFFFRHQDRALETFSCIVTLLNKQYQKYNPKIVLDVIEFIENEIALDEQESRTLEEIKHALDRS